MTAANLGAVAIKAAVERAGVENLIDEVLMGCVLQAGQGQAPARQAALQAEPVGRCATIHKVCGSAMKATMLGHDGIAVGSYARRRRRRHGSMTNAPTCCPGARQAATASATASMTTTCSSTGWKTPTAKTAAA